MKKVRNNLFYLMPEDELRKSYSEFKGVGKAYTEFDRLKQLPKVSCKSKIRQKVVPLKIQGQAFDAVQHQEETKITGSVPFIHEDTCPNLNKTSYQVFTSQDNQIQTGQIESNTIVQNPAVINSTENKQELVIDQPVQVSHGVKNIKKLSNGVRIKNLTKRIHPRARGISQSSIMNRSSSTKNYYSSKIPDGYQGN